MQASVAAWDLRLVAGSPQAKERWYEIPSPENFSLVHARKGASKITLLSLSLLPLEDINTRQTPYSKQFTITTQDWTNTREIQSTDSSSTAKA